MTLLDLARQPPLSMRFYRQEYWSGLPCSPSGDLPEPDRLSRSALFLYKDEHILDPVIKMFLITTKHLA